MGKAGSAVYWQGKGTTAGFVAASSVLAPCPETTSTETPAQQHQPLPTVQASRLIFKSGD